MSYTHRDAVSNHGRWAFYPIPKERRKGRPFPGGPGKKESPIENIRKKRPAPSPATHHRICENVPWEPEEILSLLEKDPSSFRALIDRKDTLGWSFIPWRIERVIEDDGRDRKSPSFEALSAILQSIRLPAEHSVTPEDGDVPPFARGYVVLVPFEWGEIHEPSGGPFRHPDVPFLMAECSEVVAYHHKSRTLWIPPSCPYEPSGLAPAAEPAPDPSFSGSVRLESSMTFGEYRERFELLKEDIRAGRFFQINYALSFSGVPDGPLDLPSLYRSLARMNPGPGMGYFAWKDRAFLSNSPERLLTVRNGWITTSPIAGTRPVESPHPGEAEAFANDPKERAEHVMTVDILRNDLGRVCLPGTVEVPRFLAIERYAHLLHLVSDIRGRSVPSLSFHDLLEAVFPGGSVTGAPKREVRKAIGEVEGRPRNYYCGSFGFLSSSGIWDLNLLIRTLFISPEGFRLPVGSGIVADSDPRREYDEIHAKARTFLERLNAQERIHRKGGRP